MKKTMIIATIIGLASPMIVSAAETDPATYQVHIRSLAASCAACHGTQGNPVPSNQKIDTTPALAGADKSDIIAKLQAFKSGERAATVMHRHAKGLTSEEIAALAEYFSSQMPRASATLKPQRLREDHAN